MGSVGDSDKEKSGNITFGKSVSRLSLWQTTERLVGIGERQHVTG